MSTERVFIPCNSANLQAERQVALPPHLPSDAPAPPIHADALEAILRDLLVGPPSNRPSAPPTSAVNADVLRLMLRDLQVAPMTAYRSDRLRRSEPRATSATTSSAGACPAIAGPAAGAQAGEIDD